MKKIFFNLTILFTIVGFSQINYTFKNGGGVLQDGKKISSDEVRVLLVKNTKALELYEKGCNKKTLGNVLLYGGTLGIGVFVINYVKLASSADIGVNYTPLVIGGSMIIASIPIKIGYSNKIKSAIQSLNEDAKNPKTTFIESSEIIANSNGIGISIKF